MTTFFAVFLLTLLVITAFGIVRARNLFVAVMLMGIFSLQMAAIFFVLDAADVALTEAAVGAGISTVLLLGALALTDAEEHPGGAGGHWLSLGAVAVTALVVLYATFDQPRLGDPDAPVHQHVAPWYLENTPRLIDIPNVVTAVLASFRGYDTLGEVFVIFTAGVGVMFVLGTPWTRLARARTPVPEAKGLRHHLIPRVVGRLLVPFIVLFGLYVQFHGDFGPGGGFQAGALIAAGLILHALLDGETAGLRAVPAHLLAGMVAVGPLIFGGVGVATMLSGSRFLDYSVLGADPVAGQHLGILLIEGGVGITVVGVLVSIFHAFAAREQKH
jgi:multicomponent Na+:H+ antiporter subunit B